MGPEKIPNSDATFQLEILSPVTKATAIASMLRVVPFTSLGEKDLRATPSRMQLQAGPPHHFWAPTHCRPTRNSNSKFQERSEMAEKQNETKGLLCAL